MGEPLVVTEPNLLRHFRASGMILASEVDGSARLQVEPAFGRSRVIGGLQGYGCERIARNRGARVPIAPLLHLGRGLWAWLGYYEEWDGESGRGKNYEFRTVGIAIHFGLKNSELKPQMFRAEWAGLARWGGPTHGFQAPDAGHPHWHFDALDSLKDDRRSERAAQLLRRLRGESEGEIREFGSGLSDYDIRELVTAQKFSGMHFASAAPWWKSVPYGGHVHKPAKVADIENWVRQAIGYIKRELRRL